MGENVAEARPVKTSWFKSLKSEFSKIVWLDRNTVFKQTVAVVLISTVVAVIIKIIDVFLKFGLDLLS